MPRPSGKREGCWNGWEGQGLDCWVTCRPRILTTPGDAQENGGKHEAADITSRGQTMAEAVSVFDPRSLGDYACSAGGCRGNWRQV